MKFFVLLLMSVCSHLVNAKQQVSISAEEFLSVFVAENKHFNTPALLIYKKGQVNEFFIGLDILDRKKERSVKSEFNMPILDELNKRAKSFVLPTNQDVLYIAISGSGCEPCQKILSDFEQNKLQELIDDDSQYYKITWNWEH